MRLRPAARHAALAVAALAAAVGCKDMLPFGTVTVSPPTAALCVGDSLAFTAQVLDNSGNPVASPRVLWTSSAPQAVTIDPARGVAHAVATGSARITASSGGATSAPATLDVPADLVPEFVPDSVVLAPGDTMTLGVRLRRVSAGLVPAHVPLIAPSSGPVATQDASGLVTAKAAGSAGLSLSACGHQGAGGVTVFDPPDSVSGWAYLWLSGAGEVRARLPARAGNFARTGGGPGFQVVSPFDNPSRFFLYEDTVALAAAGAFPLDSLRTTEVTDSLACRPPRPFAMFTDQTSPAAVTLLFGLRGDSLHVTTFVRHTGFAAVSGRMLFRMRGEVAGQLGPGGSPDTLAAVYTFSAPLVTWGGVCP